jgi:hypothetical protein
MAGEGIAAEDRDVRFEITHSFNNSTGIGKNGEILCWFIDSHRLLSLVSIPNSI